MSPADFRFTALFLKVLTAPAGLPGLHTVSRLITAAILTDGPQRPRSVLLLATGVLPVVTATSIPILATTHILDPLAQRGHITDTGFGVGLYAVCLYTWCIAAIWLDALLEAVQRIHRAQSETADHSLARAIGTHNRPGNLRFLALLAGTMATSYAAADFIQHFPAAVIATSIHATIPLIAAATVIHGSHRP